MKTQLDLLEIEICKKLIIEELLIQEAMHHDARMVATWTADAEYRAKLHRTMKTLEAMEKELEEKKI
jgi:hypothetical protein